MGTDPGERRQAADVFNCLSLRYFEQKILVACSNLFYHILRTNFVFDHFFFSQWVEIVNSLHQLNLTSELGPRVAYEESDPYDRFVVDF